MRKTILALFVAVFSVVAVQAQSFEGKGKSDISVGLASGFNGYDHLGIQGNYNVGVHDFVSVGLQANMWFSDFNMYIGPRANFHLLNCLNPSTTTKFDVYASATMGVRFGDKTQFTAGGYIGAKYDVSSTISIKAEVGSNPMLGVVFRL